METTGTHKDRLNRILGRLRNGDAVECSADDMDAIEGEGINVASAWNRARLGVRMEFVAWIPANKHKTACGMKLSKAGLPRDLERKGDMAIASPATAG